MNTAFYGIGFQIAVIANGFTSRPEQREQRDCKGAEPPQPVTARGRVDAARPRPQAKPQVFRIAKAALDAPAFAIHIDQCRGVRRLKISRLASWPCLEHKPRCTPDIVPAASDKRWARPPLSTQSAAARISGLDEPTFTWTSKGVEYLACPYHRDGITRSQSCLSMCRSHYCGGEWRDSCFRKSPRLAD